MPDLKASDIITRYSSCIDEDLLETREKAEKMLQKIIVKLQKNIVRLKELTSKVLVFG